MARRAPAVALIGGGTMAQAILAGGRSSGVVDPSRVIVAEPDAGRHAALQALAVAEIVSDAPSAIDRLARLEGGAEGQVILAVKPQSLDAVAAALKQELGAERRIVLSILAGTPSAVIRARLGPAASVIRVMPNTPARIGHGMSAVSLGAGARPGDERFALELFGAIGDAVVLDESLMDAFTAVAGSGPAYVFYLGEAMVTAAIELGFEPALAERIVRRVLDGSTRLLSESDALTPADLRRAVTSKGGTTAAALHVLEGADLTGTFVSALTAARDRGRELARLVGGGDAEASG